MAWIAPRRSHRAFLFLLFWSSEGLLFAATEFARAPYLQKATARSMVVRWRTVDASAGVVRFGLNPADLTGIASEPDNVTEHIVALAGLEPATKYFYSVGTTNETMAVGEDYFFVTHPEVGTRQPTRVWAIGDSGTFGTGSGNALGVRDAYYNFTGSQRTDVWLALGDNAYYNGTDAEYQRSFFNVYTALLRQTAVWPTLGNHETYGPGANGQFAYHNIFSLPTSGEAGGMASGTENYYSFDYANIHFVCLDSELSDRSLTGPMLEWLTEDLKANTQDWLVAYWHSPPYTKGSHDSDNLLDNRGNMIEMRENVVPVLESFGVDLVLGGHSHIYERSFLLNGHYGFSSTLTPSMLLNSGSGRVNESGAYVKGGEGSELGQGTVYIVAGSSGWATTRTGHHPIMYYDELDMGSLVLDFDRDRLNVYFLRETGDIDDYFSIVKRADADSFRILSLILEDDQLSVQWKSSPGSYYQVLATPDLSPPAWAPVSGVIPATGLVTSWTNSIPLSQSFFFRVSDVTEAN